METKIKVTLIVVATFIFGAIIFGIAFKAKNQVMQPTEIAATIVKDEPQSMTEEKADGPIFSEVFIEGEIVKIEGRLTIKYKEGDIPLKISNEADIYRKNGEMIEKKEIIDIKEGIKIRAKLRTTTLSMVEIEIL